MFWQRLLRGSIYALLICIAVYVAMAILFPLIGEGLAMYFCLIFVIVLCGYFLWCKLDEVLQALKHNGEDDDEAE